MGNTQPGYSDWRISAQVLHNALYSGEPDKAVLSGAGAVTNPAKAQDHAGTE